MSVKHIEYLKVKDSKLLVVEVRPVKCFLDTPSGPTYTDKWMDYSHWKELRRLLMVIVDEYEEQKNIQDVKYNLPKCKYGRTIQIGYMFRHLNPCWCSLHFLTPRSRTWIDDDDDDGGGGGDGDSQNLQDKGGRFESLVACGEMLVISVILSDAPEAIEPVLSQNSRSSHHQSSVNKKLVKALNNKLEYTNSISDYFNSAEESSYKSAVSSTDKTESSHVGVRISEASSCDEKDEKNQISRIIYDESDNKRHGNVNRFSSLPVTAPHHSSQEDKIHRKLSGNDSGNIIFDFKDSETMSNDDRYCDVDDLRRFFNDSTTSQDFDEKPCQNLLPVSSEWDVNNSQNKVNQEDTSYLQSYDNDYESSYNYTVLRNVMEHPLHNADMPENVQENRTQINRQDSIKFSQETSSTDIASYYSMASARHSEDTDPEILECSKDTNQLFIQRAWTELAMKATQEESSHMTGKDAHQSNITKRRQNDEGQFPDSSGAIKRPFLYNSNKEMDILCESDLPPVTKDDDVSKNKLLYVQHDEDSVISSYLEEHNTRDVMDSPNCTNTQSNELEEELSQAVNCNVYSSYKKYFEEENTSKKKKKNTKSKEEIIKPIANKDHIQNLAASETDYHNSSQLSNREKKMMHHETSTSNSETSPEFECISTNTLFNNTRKKENKPSGDSVAPYECVILEGSEENVTPRSLDNNVENYKSCMNIRNFLKLHGTNTNSESIQSKCKDRVKSSEVNTMKRKPEESVQSHATETNDIVEITVSELTSGGNEENMSVKDSHSDGFYSDYNHQITRDLSPEIPYPNSEWTSENDPYEPHIDGCAVLKEKNAYFVPFDASLDDENSREGNEDDRSSIPTTPDTDDAMADVKQRFKKSAVTKEHSASPHHRAIGKSRVSPQKKRYLSNPSYTPKSKKLLSEERVRLLFGESSLTPLEKDKESDVMSEGNVSPEIERTKALRCEENMSVRRSKRIKTRSVRCYEDVTDCFHTRFESSESSEECSEVDDNSIEIERKKSRKCAEKKKIDSDLKQQKISKYIDSYNYRKNKKTSHLKSPDKENNDVTDGFLKRKNVKKQHEAKKQSVEVSAKEVNPEPTCSKYLDSDESQDNNNDDMGYYNKIWNFTIPDEEIEDGNKECKASSQKNKIHSLGKNPKKISTQKKNPKKTLTTEKPPTTEKSPKDIPKKNKSPRKIVTKEKSTQKILTTGKSSKNITTMKKRFTASSDAHTKKKNTKKASKDISSVGPSSQDAIDDQFYQFIQNERQKFDDLMEKHSPRTASDSSLKKSKTSKVKKKSSQNERDNDEECAVLSEVNKQDYLHSLRSSYKRLVNMTNNDLERRLDECLPYLEEVIRGVIPNERHVMFKNTSIELKQQQDYLIYGPFTPNQCLFVLDLLKKKLSHMDDFIGDIYDLLTYRCRVLVPAFFTKIIMDNEKVSWREAYRLMGKFSLSKEVTSDVQSTDSRKF